MRTLCFIAFVLFACSYLDVAQSRVEKDLIALENRFNEALVRADLKTIEDIEADDLIFTDSSGMVTTKGDELQSMRSGDVKFESIKMDNTRVQDFGNLAVVTGRLVEKAQYKDADISGTYRFTDVWAKRKAKWEHVAGQETLVVQRRANLWIPKAYIAAWTGRETCFKEDCQKRDRRKQCDRPGPR